MSDLRALGPCNGMTNHLLTIADQGATEISGNTTKGASVGATSDHDGKIVMRSWARWNSVTGCLREAVSRFRIPF